MHGAHSEPPPFIVSGTFCIDESAEHAEQQGHMRLSHTMRAAVKNYRPDRLGTFAALNGFEQYENMGVIGDTAEDDPHSRPRGGDGKPADDDDRADVGQ